MSNTGALPVIDYILFVVFIVICTGLPLWDTFKKKRASTKADYVFSKDSKVSTFSMMMSLARATLGVRAILGYPSEMYYRGSGLWETLYGMIAAYPIICFVFLPVYYSLGITSVYQYLDLRFKSRLVRCLASGTYVVRSLLNLGVTVFTPCVALKTVVGMPYWASITSITAISVFFTILGGLKAAIHADVIQGLTMLVCSLAIIIQGCMNSNGASQVLSASQERGRMQFFNFNTDPTVRMTTLSAFFGQLFISLSIFGCQQSFVQRYVSMESEKLVVKTLLGNIPFVFVLFSLSWVAGMAIFANYIDCDPLKFGRISMIDEIVPFYVEDQFQHVPGLLGIFMSALFNGALSLSVSIINSLSTVTWEDFFCQVPKCKELADKTQLICMKMIGAFYGLIIIAIAFGVALFSGVIESSMLLTSATSGPLLGVFLLAMLFPCCNWKGAAFGMIISHVITLWITIASLMQEKGVITLLPLSTEGCTNESYSHVTYRETITSPVYRFNSSAPELTNSSHLNFLEKLYTMTYMYYTILGCCITILIGIVFSYMTGTTSDDTYEEKLIHPLALKISRLFPGSPRKYLLDVEQKPNKTTEKKIVREY